MEREHKRSKKKGNIFFCFFFAKISSNHRLKLRRRLRDLEPGLPDRRHGLLQRRRRLGQRPLPLRPEPGLSEAVVVVVVFVAFVIFTAVPAAAVPAARAARLRCYCSPLLPLQALRRRLADAVEEHGEPKGLPLRRLGGLSSLTVFHRGLGSNDEAASAGERAELATSKYIALAPVLEGVVILKPNPDYVEVDHE